MLTPRNFLECFCILVAVEIISAYPKDVATAFKRSNLVPDVTSCTPNYELQVEYPNGNFVYPGKKLSPLVTVKAPGIEFPADPSTYYTLVMVDPDIPIPTNTTRSSSEFRHWVVGNIPGDDVYAGETLAEYINPTPPPVTGAHRYAFLVYKQKGRITFKEPKLLAKITTRFVPISVLVKEYELGCPVFGNFFLSAAKYIIGGTLSERIPLLKLI